MPGINAKIAKERCMEVYKEVFESRVMPENGKIVVIAPLNKCKGKRTVCKTYRFIRLFS